MFNPEFYPTPDNLINVMLSNQKFNNKTVLEPSAGKGNIVDKLREYGAEVLLCENHPELAQIVQSKGRFLKADFFDVKSEEISHIDHIVMNPPFSNADKHILHAFDIAPEGCTITAICNVQTLDNAYSQSRKTLKHLINEHGFFEAYEMAFADAERSTNVEVAVIEMYKPRTSEETEFDGYFETQEEYEDATKEGILPYNFIRDVVQRYVGAVKLYDKVLENGAQMKQLLHGVSSYHKISFTCSVDEKVVLRKTFKKDLQREFWSAIFAKLKMDKYVTKSVKADINKFIEKQNKVPFTMGNIYKMIDLIIGTWGNTMDKVYIDAFDRITKHFDENRYQVEGWKTNSHYMINKKFILPYITEVGFHGGMSYHYNGYIENVEDMMKALCYLTGNDFNSYPRLSLFISNKMTFGEWYDWGFFEIKGFKKGTMHFKFKDLKVWEAFNRKVAEIKGYPLPNKF